MTKEVLTVYDRPNPKELLTTRQAEILFLTAQGFNTKGITRRLGIVENTVNYHKTKLYIALGVSSGTEACITGIDRGYLDPKSLVTKEERIALGTLTDREREILEKYTEDSGRESSYLLVSTNLDMDNQTLKDHLGDIFLKLRAGNNTRACVIYHSDKKLKAAGDELDTKPPTTQEVAESEPVFAQTLDVLRKLAVGTDPETICETSYISLKELKNHVHFAAVRLGTVNPLHTIITCFESDLLDINGFYNNGALGILKELTPRQHELLSIMVRNQGRHYKNKELSSLLNTFDDAAAKYFSDIYKRTRRYNRLQLGIMYYLALKRGLI